MGVPDGSNTLGVNSGWQLVNSRNTGGSYEYRWGLGPGGWDVQLGIDATDSEFDCSGDASGSATNYFMISVREGDSSEPWIPTFSYRYKNARDFNEPWWDALHTAGTLGSVASVAPTMASSFGNAFNCVVDGTCRSPPSGPPGAWEEIGLKLECTNGGTTHTLEWTNLPASAAALLVSPTPAAWTCQGKGSHTANTGCKNYNVRRPHMRTSAL